MTASAMSNERASWESALHQPKCHCMHFRYFFS